MSNLKCVYILFLFWFSIVGKSCKQIPVVEDKKNTVNLFMRDDICKPKPGFGGLYHESLLLNKVTKYFEYSYEYYNGISMHSSTDKGVFHMESDTLNLIYSEPSKNYFEESYNAKRNSGEYKFIVNQTFESPKRASRMGFTIRINDTIDIVVFDGEMVWQSTEDIKTVRISTAWVPFQSKIYKVSPSNNEFVFNVFDGKVFDRVTYLWQKDTLIPIGSEGISGRCKMILESPKK